MHVKMDPNKAVSYLRNNWLNKEAGLALGRQVEAGNAAAREAMVMAYIRVVTYHAERLHSINPDISQEELEEVGLITLGICVERFDPDRGFTFLTYIGGITTEGEYVPGIIGGAMIDHIRTEKKYRTEKVQLALYQKEHIAEEDSVLGEKELGIIETCLTGKVSDRDRDIMISYLGGEKQKAIARRLEVAPSRISQIVTKCRKILREIYQKNEFSGGMDPSPLIRNILRDLPEGINSVDTLYEHIKGIPGIYKFCKTKDILIQILRGYDMEDFENQKAKDIIDEANQSEVLPQAISQAKDKHIARVCVRFFLRKGIYFKYGLEDVYQEVYLAFARARQDSKKELSEYELIAIGFRAVSALIRDNIKYAKILKKLKAEDIKPLEDTTFNARLKISRRNKSLTQKELASLIGVDKQAISNWETTQRLPTPQHMVKLAGVLDVTVSYLLTGMPEEELMNIRIEDERSPEYRKLFGFKIKVLRYKAGLTLEELGKKIGTTTVWYWESGNCKTLPHPQTMKKLAEALNTTISQLLAGMPEEELMNIRIEGDSPEYKKLFGFKIKVLRYKAGLTQEELAKKTGLFSPQISNYETGKIFPPPDDLKKFAKAFSTTPEKLLGHEKNQLLTTDQEQPFLRNLTKPKELSQNMIEAVLSILLSGKKLVLAFDSGIGGLQSSSPLGVFRSLKALKKDPKFKKLLKNLIIIETTTENMHNKIQAYFGEENTEVLVYARKSEKERLQKLENKTRINLFYINENGFTTDAWYPLTEIVTLTLIKHLNAYNIDELLAVINESNIELKQLNIASIKGDKGIIIFDLLPSAKPYSPQELRRENARLKRLVKSA